MRNVPEWKTSCAFYRRIPGSIQDQFIWDSWWTGTWTCYSPSISVFTC